MKKVVLIDNKECGLKLTIGKIYSVIKIHHREDIDYSVYEISDDNDEICYPIVERFY